jgi:hypothetical protein
MPSSWEGWSITLLFVLYVLSRALSAETQPVRFYIELIVLVIILIVISKKKTDGEWKWRWGNK